MCLPQLQHGTASPSLNPGLLCWGKGSTAPCSCTAVSVLAEERPLDVPTSISLLLQRPALILAFVRHQQFSPPSFTCYLIVCICLFWLFGSRPEPSLTFPSLQCHINICCIDEYIHQLNFILIISFPNQDNSVTCLEFFVSELNMLRKNNQCSCLYDTNFWLLPELWELERCLLT